MTPLAHRIVKELTLPFKRRTFNDEAQLLRRMGDVHCFELSEIIDLWDEVALSIRDTGTVDERTSFLPAPKTWIEAIGHRELVGGFCRCGWLLEETKRTDVVSVSFAIVSDENQFGSDNFGELYLGRRDQAAYADKWAKSSSLLLAALAIINTPRIIGRAQHMPHRGLERALIAQQKAIGKFPLHAWTEIKLSVTPPKDMAGDGSYEAHLTGQRALHFCRAHLRVRLGRLEIVRSHWRGDGSLGIKQSRYKLTMPKLTRQFEKDSHHE